MKKILTVSLLLNCVLFGSHLGERLVVHAGPGGVLPLGNGDVNGDGAYNLSDAVYLLTWLFRGGSAPVDIDGSPPAPPSLPATGQGFCNNPDGAEVGCAEANCSGQDGAYQAGCPMEGRFVDHGDGTVTDTCTGLMWQRQTGDVDADGGIGEQDLVTWCGGLAYCEGLTLGGHDDWRLPNVRELQSLVDYGRTWPALDPVFEAPGGFSCYMSSTSLRGGPGPGVFTVDFGMGLVGGGGGIVCHARAVRDAASR